MHRISRGTGNADDARKWLPTLALMVAAGVVVAQPAMFMRNEIKKWAKVTSTLKLQTD